MIRQFVSDSIAYGTATVLSRATMMVALLVLPLILTPRDYGALSMIVTVAILVSLLAPMEVSHGLGRHYPSATPAAKKAYASSAWTFLLFMLALFLALGQAFAEPLCVLILGDPAYLAVFRIALVMMALNCLFYFLQNQCRWEFRTAEFVLISLVFSFLTLALSLGLAFLVGPPLLGVVLGQALGAAVAVGLGGFGLRRSFALRIDRDRLREMLRFSLPLVPASLALFLSVHASRIILNALSTLDNVGFYTLAVQIAGISTLGVVGVQLALIPLVIAHHEKPETPRHLARLFEAFFGFAVVAALFLGLFAPEFIRYVWGPAYAGVGPLVLVLAPAVLLAQMYLFAPGFTVAKRTDLQMWVSFAGALVAILANFALIPLWGTLGAAVATLASAIVFLGLWLLLSQLLYPLPIRWGAVALTGLAGVLLGAVGQGADSGPIVASLAVKALVVAAAASLVNLIGLVPVRAAIAALRAFAVSRRSPDSA